MNYKCLLLDIDNTLLDFTSAAEYALQTGLAENNVTLNPKIHAIYKKENHATWVQFEKGEITALRLRTLRFERFFKAADISNISPEEFSVSFLNHLVQGSEAYDGVIDLLHALKKNYTLAVITNGLKEVQRPRIARLNMTGLFDTIVVSDEIGVAKPDTRFFDYAYKSLNNHYDKSELLVVGDNLHSDIIGGKNYGLDTCWIAHNRTNETDIIPTKTINHFLDISSVLK